MSKDYAEHHPGYSFTAPDGTEVRVPSARITPAAAYHNEPMTRAEAGDILIAFGLASDCTLPIRCRPNGAGFDAVIPLEFVAGLDGVRRVLDERNGAPG
jgi:hypothetical protein